MRWIYFKDLAVRDFAAAESEDLIKKKKDIPNIYKFINLN